ncbi:CCC motif membrane protein [Lutimonas zeaxanthinifaciens]|uniref:CCC motif membrane protein n=1 Tax=Lutimonas zeaxanthinifaciens TaxID=3060215 RepID=UPI00265C9AC9|nr:CCC motif membrane protein [Lutimonas sp. YSD2104]WKK67420.1 CCC motif membrane protein [Lutimonas sp. YSD2104]
MYKEKLPYSRSALILGISSIITACCCWGLIGVILGIIGLTNANKAIQIHEEDPNAFDGINNAQTGKTTSIIGIIIGILLMIWHIYTFSTGDYEILFEEYNNMLDEY